jgi:hypothetical protein
MVFARTQYWRGTPREFHQFHGCRPDASPEGTICALRPAIDEANALYDKLLDRLNIVAKSAALTGG